MTSLIDEVQQRLMRLIRHDDAFPNNNVSVTEIKILEQISNRLCIPTCGDSNEITPIRHIRQADTWDCGLACMQMIIQWLCNISHASTEELETQRIWMADFVKAKSLWTIDLVILLQNMRNNLNCSTTTYLFCSNQFGINESYTNFHYYKDAFSNDEVRVKRLFNMAYQLNLPLLQVGRMSMNIFIELVSRENIVAIVLLDNSIYNQQHSSSSCIEPTTKSSGQSDSYSGHYVVVCGVSRDESDIAIANVNSQNGADGYNYCLVIKNPGVWKDTEFVSPALFEKSWRAKGTDEDIVFVSKHPDRMVKG